jgi:hypothetical protein
VFERADTVGVLAVATPVMALEDVLTTKLHAIDEHSLDYTHLVSIARSVREQIDWGALRNRSSESPYAKAFFTLVEELGIAPARPSALQPGSHTRVRVVNPGGV